MKTTASYWIGVGSILAFLSVLAGALGAHWLDPVMDMDSKDTYETSVRFQMFHSVALILIGIILNFKFEFNRRFFYIPWLVLAGTVIFCGSLYTISLSSFNWLGAVAPFGALLFIFGWLLLAFSVFNIARQNQNKDDR